MLNLEFSTDANDPEAGFDQFPVDPRGSAISSSPHLYRLDMDRALAEHTGSSNKLLNEQQEQALAVTIQTGRTAEEQLEALRVKEPAKYAAEKSKYEQIIWEGIHAQTVVIESNLRFAAFLARASMNILPKASVGDGEDESQRAQATGRKRRKEYIGSFSDITKLRSPHAELDARIQVANIGLMRAAAKFEPKLSKDNTPIRFSTFATWHIQSELTRHAKAYETPGWYLPQHIVDAITLGHNNPAEMTYQLRGWDAGRYTIPIESVNFPDSTIEDEEEPTETLTLAELAQDDDVNVEGEALEFGAVDIVSQVLKQLATIEDKAGERPADRAIRQANADRAAAILKMRFGISDNPDKYGGSPSLDEVGRAFGITRERVRQIEAKSFAKLRRMLGGMSARSLLDTVEPVNAASYLPPKTEYTGQVRTTKTVAYGGRDLRGPTFSIDFPDLATYRFAHGTLRTRPYEPLAAPYTHAIHSARSSEPKESWQTYADEPFDLWEADAIDEAERHLSYDMVAREFKDFLFNTAPDLFDSYFMEEMHSEYPIKLVEAISRHLGNQLTAEHIESFWNSHLETIISSLVDAEDSHSLNVVSTFFSKLLAERMTDDSVIELHIPESLSGKLNYLGAWITNGHLEIQGNAGDFAGYKLSGIGNVMIRGSAGDFAGVKADGYSELTVNGNVGHFFAGQARGSSSLIAVGSAGEYCGEGMNGTEVSIFVGGDAGNEVASDAQSGAITVIGSVASIAESRNPKVTLLLPRDKVTMLKPRSDRRAS